MSQRYLKQACIDAFDVVLKTIKQHYQMPSALGNGINNSWVLIAFKQLPRPLSQAQFAEWWNDWESYPYANIDDVRTMCHDEMVKCKLLLPPVIQMTNEQCFKVFWAQIRGLLSDEEDVKKAYLSSVKSRRH